MYEFLKRSIDVTFAFTGLLLISPVFLIIAFFIKLDSRGPVIFKQERMGKGGRVFVMYKFRTMIVGNGSGNKLITSKGEKRITRAGRLLRKLKVDELPQLINIIKGEMSFVGPRPEVAKYVEMFRNEYNEVLEIPPGITDYAAIEFSNEEELLTQFDDPEKGYVEDVLPRKIVLYKKYLNERGMWVDIKILCMTICKLAGDK